MVPFIFSKTGYYNITLIVTDALGENTSHSVEIKASPGWVNNLIENLSPGTLSYFIDVLPLLFGHL